LTAAFGMADAAAARSARGVSVLILRGNSDYVGLLGKRIQGRAHFRTL